MVGQHGGGAEQRQHQYPADVDFGPETIVAKGQNGQFDQGKPAYRKTAVGFGILPVAVGVAKLVKEQQQAVPERKVLGQGQSFGAVAVVVAVPVEHSTVVAEQEQGSQRYQQQQQGQPGRLVPELRPRPPPGRPAGARSAAAVSGGGRAIGLHR